MVKKIIVILESATSRTQISVFFFIGKHSLQNRLSFFFLCFVFCWTVPNHKCIIWVIRFYKCCQVGFLIDESILINVVEWLHYTVVHKVLLLQKFDFYIYFLYRKMNQRMVLCSCPWYREITLTVSWSTMHVVEDRNISIVISFLQIFHVRINHPGIRKCFFWNWQFRSWTRLMTLMN